MLPPFPPSRAARRRRARALRLAAVGFAYACGRYGLTGAVSATIAFGALAAYVTVVAIGVATACSTGER